MSFSEKVERFARGVIKTAQRGPRARTITNFRGEPTSYPRTALRAYICSNCGKLIESTQGHTLTECEAYQSDPTNPDGRAHRTIMDRRNAPKIELPYYTKEAEV